MIQKIGLLGVLLIALAGCASTEKNLYQFSAQNGVKAGAKYWLQTFDFSTNEAREMYMKPEQLEQAFLAQFKQELSQQGKMASSAADADYLLEVKVDYLRNFNNQQANVALFKELTETFNDGKILVSVDFHYDVNVIKDGNSLVQFKQSRNNLTRAGWGGVFGNIKNLAAVVTNDSTPGREQMYIEALPKMIVKDVSAIPTL